MISKIISDKTCIKNEEHNLLRCYLKTKISWERTDLMVCKKCFKVFKIELNEQNVGKCQL